MCFASKEPFRRRSLWIAFRVLCGCYDSSFWLSRAAWVEKTGCTWFGCESRTGGITQGRVVGRKLIPCEMPALEITDAVTLCKSKCAPKLPGKWVVTFILLYQCKSCNLHALRSDWNRNLVVPCTSACWNVPGLPPQDEQRLYVECLLYIDTDADTEIMTYLAVFRSHVCHVITLDLVSFFFFCLFQFKLSAASNALLVLNVILDETCISFLGGIKTMKFISIIYFIQWNCYRAFNNEYDVLFKKTSAVLWCYSPCLCLPDCLMKIVYRKRFLHCYRLFHHKRPRRWLQKLNTTNMETVFLKKKKIVTMSSEALWVIEQDAK